MFLVLTRSGEASINRPIQPPFVHNLASKLVRDAEAIAIPPSSGYLLEALLLAPRHRND